MTRDEAKRLGEILVAYGDGKVIEFELYPGVWIANPFPGLNEPPERYRVVPDPPPRTREDWPVYKAWKAGAKIEMCDARGDGCWHELEDPQFDCLDEARYRIAPEPCVPAGNGLSGLGMVVEHRDAAGTLKFSSHPEAEPTVPAGNAHDPVNRPKHYATDPSGYECIRFTRRMDNDHGNAFKYLWRHEQKGGTQDLEKSLYYLRDIAENIRSYDSEPLDIGEVQASRPYPIGFVMGAIWERVCGIRSLARLEEAIKTLESEIARRKAVQS